MLGDKMTTNEWIQIASVVSQMVLVPVAIYIAKSISELNIKMAVIISRVDSHEHRIDKLEDIRT